MPQRNLLTRAPPYEVERAVRHLGSNLRTARLRRNLTVRQVADKIGTGPRAVMDAEKGKPTTSIAVYGALLWAHDLLGPMADLADPSRDGEGLALEGLRGRVRARAGAGLDDDF